LPRSLTSCRRSPTPPIRLCRTKDRRQIVDTFRQRDIAFVRHNLIGGVGERLQLVSDRAENATLWDIEGNEVIDFAAGIAVLNTGHRHPKVVADKVVTHYAYAARRRLLATLIQF
jgi:4-aminobutyrate aminotransferase-like enzyme